MNRPLINYDDFELPFLVQWEEQQNDDATEDLSHAKQLEQMQDQIPENVLFLGGLNNEVAHSPGLTWETQDFYYIMPWMGEEYDWAMFRISWDDNWGRYEWTSDVRIRGVADSDEAAREMFKGLMDRWGYDLSNNDQASYKEFLDGISSKTREPSDN
jgi:hypothetical protein